MLNLGLKKKAVKQEPQKPTPPRQTLPIADIVPNGWNMNVMEPSAYKKLKAWIQRSLQEAGKLALPVVVRTNPTQPGKWEIIDGYHRWKACSELKETVVDAMVYECDEKSARLLTDALNYLRGDRNPEKYVEYIRELVDRGVTKDEITQFTNVTADELTELGDMYDIKIEDVELPKSGEEEEQEAKQKDPDEWVKMEFLVPQSAAEVIEAELARVGSVLTGKNVRGRALEFIAVQSAQTPLPDVVPAQEEKRVAKTKAKLEMLAGKKRRSHAA